MAGVLRSTTRSGAISAAQFLEQFQTSWTESRLTQTWSWSRRVPRRLGLAISGGADSMALAYLCRRMQIENLIDGLSVTAFVVDHKARQESSREARMVIGWLRDMGLNARVLELEWTGLDSPSKVSAFETHARRLRFQALGSACRDAGIETLLMGHHQDDNVETTLWRLCSGARGAGLTGIPSVARIPECHGLYGVSESGLQTVLRSNNLEPDLKIRIDQKNEARMTSSSRGKKASSTETPQHDEDTTISTGGILICRPLLSFPKSNLVTTCNENNIPFVNDPTNFDPTLTPRNAIRHLLSTEKLPKALRPPSILSLIERSKELVDKSNELSNELLKTCRIHKFNSRAGWMVVRFPSPSSDNNDKNKDERQRRHNLQIQALTLRRITELLSPFPENYFSLRSYEKFAGRLFAPSKEENRQPFTVGGVIFRPVREEIENDKTTDQKQSRRNTYLLSRQPYMRHRLPTLNFEFPSPTTADLKDMAKGSNSTCTPWYLWDDRYWIRLKLTHRVHTLQNGNKDPSGPLQLTVRPLQSSDLKEICRALDESEGREEAEGRLPSSQEFLDMLSWEAPGPIRFTVPLLTAREPTKPDEWPLALLTLPGRSSSGGTMNLGRDESWRVECEWTYKMINPEPLELMGWLKEVNTLYN
ncbi:hypothetical protein DTO282E5_6933 [Paecilomyces variotii]|nr:hypothetical protein DTO282E5_6933 [Paecilomyces variotii]